MEASRFCKPRNSAHKQQIRTNQIKSFRRSPMHKNLPPATFVRPSIRFVGTKSITKKPSLPGVRCLRQLFYGRKIARYSIGVQLVCLRKTLEKYGAFSNPAEKATSLMGSSVERKRVCANSTRQITKNSTIVRLVHSLNNRAK